jgi:hypothetical protein
VQEKAGFFKNVNVDGKKLIFPCQRYEGIEGSRGIAPLILKLGAR